MDEPEIVAGVTVPEWVGWVAAALFTGFVVGLVLCFGRWAL